MKKHIASCAIIGVTGHRVGTSYIYEQKDVEPARLRPHFRFRNNDCKIEYIRWSKSRRIASAIRARAQQESSDAKA